MFEQLNPLGACDGVYFFIQPSLALDNLHEVLDANSSERSPGALQRQQLIHLFGRHPPRPLGISLDPTEQFRLTSLIVRGPLRVIVPVARVGVHARQEQFQRNIAKHANAQAKSPGTSAHGRDAAAPLAAGAEDLADRVPMEPGEPSEILLIPASFFDQARNLLQHIQRNRLAVHGKRSYSLPLRNHRSVGGSTSAMRPMLGKVVLVTGGSSGIGRGTAVRLATLGAQIAVAARDEKALSAVAEEVGRLGARALAVPTDVTSAEQCRQAVETTVAHFGALDVLVCSAGLSMRTYFEGSDLAAMERVVQVNFFGTLYATYFAVPHVKRSRGSLVAISSLTGKRGIPSYAVYGASKFAVQGLYDSLRLELRATESTWGWCLPGLSILRFANECSGATDSLGRGRQIHLSAFGLWQNAWTASCT